PGREPAAPPLVLLARGRRVLLPQEPPALRPASLPRPAPAPPRPGRPAHRQEPAVRQSEPGREPAAPPLVLLARGRRVLLPQEPPALRPASLPRPAPAPPRPGRPAHRQLPAARPSEPARDPAA